MITKKLTCSVRERNGAIGIVRKRIRRGFRRWTVTPEEWNFLYKLTIDRRPGAILEIGSYIYTSSLAFLRAMKICDQTILVSIDLAHREFKYDKIGDRWIRLTGESQIIMPNLEQKFDMIFIDGRHDVAGCSDDFTNALCLLNSGGIIIFHDANNRNVKKAIKLVRPNAEIIWYKGKPTGIKGLATYEP